MNDAEVRHGARLELRALIRAAAAERTWLLFAFLVLFYPMVLRQIEKVRKEPPPDKDEPSPFVYTMR